ncbi:lytic murein transglycosylase B [Alcaligenaceae bacterium]|nr:lytic murein transglycosylase B [Alcaligenaceae bacterium]
MSKRVRTLSTCALAMLLAGCASSQTTVSPLATAQETAPAAALQSPPNLSSQAAPTAAPIKAGASAPGITRYTSDSGQLIPSILAYAHEVAQTRNIPQQRVIAILEQARHNATVVRLMTPSGTRIRRSWITYRNRFVEPIRIKKGLAFWQEHQSTLDKAFQTYGVPPSIVTAIIGVETIYGQYMGNFRVLDALATLGFSNPDTKRPERSQLFRDQLADLMLLDHQNKLDALHVEGSFAGAMGLPQFMPGSLLRYAVDGNGDGKIDLINNVDDAIMSVASFLSLHGWIGGLPVFAPVNLPAQPAALVKGGLDPSLTWETLVKQGARVKGTASTQQWQRHGLGVIDLLDEPRKLEEYRTGTPNFFAITHYNRSYFYATSVADLASALASQMGYGGPN